MCRILIVDDVVHNYISACLMIVTVPVVQWRE